MIRTLWTSCAAALVLALLVCVTPAMAQDKTAAPATTTEAAKAPAADATKAPAADATKAPAAEKPAERGFLEMNSEFCRQVDDFITKTKKPCDCFTWGADLRLREVWGDNWTTLNESTNNHERHFERYRTRVWGTLTPVKNIDLNARLVWEPRVIQQGPPTPGFTTRDIWDEVLFDILNVKFKNVADLPLTVTGGRMEIIKGDGWLVLDGTPLDGSRTLYFNAVQAIWEEEKIKTTFEVDYIHNDDEGNLFFAPWNDTHQPVIEQDESGVIFYVTNKSIDKTIIEGYYIYKHDEPHMATGADGQTHTVGTRLKSQLNNNLEGRTEFAYQWGEQAFPANMHSHRAFATNNRVTYFFRDKMSSQVKAEYEFLSGDDPDTATNEGFDPLWGRWPQWSELYVYTMALERGRPGEMSNLHRLGFGYETNPCKVLNFHVNYHLLFADENSQKYSNPARFSGAGAFRGQLLESKLTAKLSEHVSSHLVAEYFVPGNFYNENALNDPAIFLRYELNFTW